MNNARSVSGAIVVILHKQILQNMKNLLALFILLTMVSFSSHAQITLIQSGYTGTYAGVSDTFLNSGSGALLAAIPPDTNANWDLYGEVTAHPLYIINSYAPSTTPYAQFAPEEQSYFSGLYVNEYMECGITDTAYSRYGDSIYRQPNNISGTTGGSTDSLIFDAQNTIFSHPQTLIKFPATYMSNWISTFRTTINFHLDVAAYLLVNTPGYQVSYLTYADTVIGWGKMRVRELGGDTSGYINVLQVKEVITEVDSFYLNGSPAPTALLTAFSVSQGQTSNSYYQYYERVAEVLPLAAVSYQDPTYDTNINVQTHTDRLPAPLAINNIISNSGNGINIYPNPVTAHLLNLDFKNDPVGELSYELLDVRGAKVATGIINTGNARHTTITLSADILPGIYFIRINKDGQQWIVRPLDVK